MKSFFSLIAALLLLIAANAKNTYKTDRDIAVGAKSFELMENEYTSLKDLQYCLCPYGQKGE